jgi:hypothetical protein
MRMSKPATAAPYIQIVDECYKLTWIAGGLTPLVWLLIVDFWAKAQGKSSRSLVYPRWGTNHQGKVFRAMPEGKVSQNGQA